MRKITVEIESADDVKVTAKSLQDKWNYNLKKEDKIKVKEISFNSVLAEEKPCKHVWDGCIGISECLKCGKFRTDED